MNINKEDRPLTLSEVKLGHLIKSEGTIFIRCIHEYFLRLNGPLAGLMLMTGQIGEWEYVGRFETSV